MTDPSPVALAHPPERTWRLGPDLEVRAHPAEPVAAALDAVFAAFAVSGPAGTAALHLATRNGAAGHELLLAGVRVATAPDLGHLAPLLEGALVGLAVRRRERCVAFHAAAVALGDGSVLLAGDKGSGKSSLGVALAREGAVYLGDEVAFVEPGPCALRPFPKAATVKEAAFEAFAPLAPTFVDRVRGPVRYVLPAGTGRADAPVAVRALVFPRFDPDALEVEVAPVDPSRAALGLVRQVFGGLGRAPESLACVARLAVAPALALRFADAGSAARRLLAWPGARG
jgi:hypothetical protein